MPATRRRKVKAKVGKGRKTQRRGGHGRTRGGNVMNVASKADIPAFERMLKKGPIVVGMFYLSWCGHCKKAEPSFKEVAAKNYPGVNFAMVNSDLKDQTTLRDIEVNGVPDFFVSVPNKGSANTTIKPEMSYDKPSIERLATVASNAATLGSANAETLSENLNKPASAGPPPFLAINSPSVKKANSVKPPSFRNLGSSQAEAKAEKEEPINAVSEESTDEEDELVVPSYESSVNMRESVNAGHKHLVKPAFSVAGEEPTSATTLSITSPVAAVSSVTNTLPESTLKAAAREHTLKEKEEAEGRNFSMIGGASKKVKSSTLRVNTNTLDYNSSSGPRKFDVTTKHYTLNGQPMSKSTYSFKLGKRKLSADSPSKLQEKIDTVLAASH